MRIRQLLKPDTEYVGWGFNQRPPRPGDTGYLVDVLEAEGVPPNYIVEASNPDGTTLWLGDFSEEELEPDEQ